MEFGEILLTRNFAAAVALLLFSCSAFAFGAGYRKAASAAFVSITVALVAGILGGIITLLVAMPLAGRGEGSAIAALLLAIAVGITCSLTSLIGGAIWVVAKRGVFLVRQPPLWGWHCAGTAGIVACGLLFVPLVPALRTAGSLAGQVGTGLDAAHDHQATDELLRRGPDAVPDLIRALQRHDENELKIFENGLTQGAQEQLRLLGRIGGPEAIRELREWLARDIAPDVRAAAARGLAAAGDSASAPAIALMLEHRSYEWRKCHPQLVMALTDLRAADELEHVRSALQFAPEEEGISYQIGLLGCAVDYVIAIDVPTGWAMLKEVRNLNDTRARVVDDLLAMRGAALPELEGQPPV